MPSRHEVHADCGKPGRYAIQAKSSDGLIYFVIRKICDKRGEGECLGIEFQVRYNADERATGERLNSAGYTYSLLKATRLPNEWDVDTVYVSHYTIMDGGQTPQNLGAILTNVLSIAPKAMAIIFPPT